MGCGKLDCFVVWWLEKTKKMCESARQNFTLKKKSDTNFQTGCIIKECLRKTYKNFISTIMISLQGMLMIKSYNTHLTRNAWKSRLTKTSKYAMLTHKIDKNM